MSDIRFEDVVVADDGSRPELWFTALGRPPVQQRPKITWKSRKSTTYYDPSSGAKISWRRELKKALVDCGVMVFPFFQEKKSSLGIKLDICFHLRRRRADYKMRKGTLVLKEEHQKYPGTKDVDNLVKFVMDAMHYVLYLDDKCVVQVKAEKKFLSEDDKGKGEHTTIKISEL